MRLKLGDVIRYICNYCQAPFFRNIHHSLNRPMSNQCHSVKIIQYLFHRRAGDKNGKTSIEPRNICIDFGRLNYKRETIVKCLFDFVHARFYGAGIMDDQLFAIDVSHDREGHTIDIHCIPNTVTIKPSAWTRLAQRYLGMTIENTSVVIIYDTNDITTVHGTRYPEFIENGVETLIQNGAIPLFWFIENNNRYGKHLYLFIVDNKYFLNTLTLVRTRETTTSTR